MSARQSSFASTLTALIVAGMAAYAATEFSSPESVLSEVLDRSFPSKDEVALVHKTTISTTDLAEELRHHLFRRGLDWSKLSPAEQEQHRQQSLQTLVDGALVRHARLKSGGEATIDDTVRDEFQDFVQEFDPRSEFERRRSLQSVTEADLLTEMAARQADQRWLLSQLPAYSVSQDEVRTHVSQRPEVRRVPECWRARHLFLSGHEPSKPDREPEIMAIFQNLTSGSASFADLIAKHSEDERTKKLGGDLGWFSDSRMPAELIAKVKSIPPNTPSAPFQTQLGWHIIEVTDHHAERSASDSEWTAEVTTQLESQHRSNAVTVFMNQLRTASVSAITIHNSILATVQPAGYDKLHSLADRLPPS